MIFNNGRGRLDENYSAADEIVPPLSQDGTYAVVAGEAFGPTAPAWSYTAPNRADFYSGFISGAIRLPNGNTLIASGGQGWIFEVTEAGAVVWEYEVHWLACVDATEECTSAAMESEDRARQRAHAYAGIGYGGYFRHLGETQRYWLALGYVGSNHTPRTHRNPPATNRTMAGGHDVFLGCGES